MLKTNRLLLAGIVIIAVIAGTVLLYALRSNVPTENGGNGNHNGTGNGNQTGNASFFFSFDQDMQGWETKALDLELGNSTIDWSITRSQENVKNGSSSLLLYLANYNDKGKIWIEQGFAVKPNTLHNVNVSYALASADWGDMNFFTIITGVLQEPPKSREQLVYQGNTGNQATSDVGHLWLNKSYSFSVESNATGKLYVIVGVWGTWETPRTYYVDDLALTFEAPA